MSSTRNVPQATDGPERRTPCVIYAARSKDEEPGKDSTGSQTALVLARVEQDPDRFVYGEPHADHASGSKGNRGPGLAAAIEDAVAAASEHGRAELWAWISSRFARGSGLNGGARALGKLFYDLRAQGVALRSVEDDEYLTNEMLIGFASQQSSKYAADLGANVSRGKRQAAERGEFVGGICPDGYRVLHEVDPHGRVVRRVEFDPDRHEVLRCIWDGALSGWSVESIVLELDRRGALTRPQKAGHSARRFDRNRVSQTLNNRFYAGQSLYKAEVVGQGQWPAFVTVEEFERAAAGRAARSSRGPGRPRREVLDYLLSGIARCGGCGQPMHGVTGRGAKSRREDGSYPRRYVCAAHGREYPKGHSVYCPAGPIDADAVDHHFAANLDKFLGNVCDWRERLATTRADERARLERQALAARGDLAESETVASKMQARYDRAIGDDDEPTAEAILGALVERRAAIARAGVRLTATLDALAAVAQEVAIDPLLDFYNRLSDELTQRIDGTSGDVRRTNAVLREYFERVDLSADAEGTRIAPLLTEAAVTRVLADPSLLPVKTTISAGDLTADVLAFTDDGRALVDIAPEHHDEFMRRMASGEAVIEHELPRGLAPKDTPPLREMLAPANPASALV